GISASANPSLGGRAKPVRSPMKKPDNSLSDVAAATRPEKRSHYMLAKLQERRGALRDESGFTLIELLVVLIIIGVLLAIAIPSYLGFQKSAQQTAAASDVRSTIPDVEEYYKDNNETYAGTPAMTAAMLQSTYDSGLQVVGVNGATNGIATVKASTA